VAVHAVEYADVVECVVARPACHIIATISIDIGMGVCQTIVVPVRYRKSGLCALASCRRACLMALAAVPRDVDDRLSCDIVVRGDRLIEFPGRSGNGELDDEDVNTTNLRQNLGEFNEKLVCVEENCELAKAAVSDDEVNSGEVQQYIRNSSRCIREANHILREMFNELRALDAYKIGIGASVSEEDGSTDDGSADETVNESADDPANESDSGTEEVGDGDTDTSGNETESESETDDGEVES